MSSLALGSRFGSSWSSDIMPEAGRCCQITLQIQHKIRVLLSPQTQEVVWPPLSTSYMNSTILGEDPERRMVRDRALHPNENSFGFFGRMAGGNLVPQPGIRPMTPAVEIRSINHWTVSEIPENCFLIPERLFSVQVRLFKLHQRFGWDRRRSMQDLILDHRQGSYSAHLSHSHDASTLVSRWWLIFTKTSCQETENGARTQPSCILKVVVNVPSVTSSLCQQWECAAQGQGWETMGSSSFFVDAAQPQASSIF